MMSLTVLSLPQRYKRLLQAMSLAVAVVYMTLLLYQSAYGYPGMQVSKVFYFYSRSFAWVSPFHSRKFSHLHVYICVSLHLPGSTSSVCRSVSVSCTFINQRWRRLQLRACVCPSWLLLRSPLSFAQSPIGTFLRPCQCLQVRLAASASASVAAFAFCLAYKTVSVFSNFIFLFFVFVAFHCRRQRVAKAFKVLQFPTISAPPSSPSFPLSSCCSLCFGFA